MSSQMTFPGFLDVTQRQAPEKAQYDRLREQIAGEFRVALPGIIVSFDSAKQTVSVQPAVTEKLLVGSVVTDVPLPVIPDVPIHGTRGGGFSVTVPVTAGDECLLIFADVCWDAWWQNGGSQNNQMIKRRHDFSNAFALLGPWSQPRVLSAYSTSSLQVRSDDGKRVIEVANGAINITVTDSSPINLISPHVNLGESPTKHLVFLEDLETLFNAHIHPTGGPNTGPPTTTLTSSNGTTDTKAA